jgi:hypothetical protein
MLFLQISSHFIEKFKFRQNYIKKWHNIHRKLTKAIHRKFRQNYAPKLTKAPFFFLKKKG